MSVAPTIEFSGPDEELEKYLLEFARRVGGRAMRRPGGGWILAAGAPLSLNPNTIAWRIRVTREGGRIATRVSSIALPWTRAKVARLAAFREGQLADYLTARLRGSPAEKFDPLRLREPFATFGADTAAVTMSFTWAAATGAACLAAALIAVTLASIPLMDLSVREIAARAGAIDQAGGLGLPRGTGGFGLRLGAAFVFAVPLAFLCGLVHALALAAADLGERAARLPQASLLFQAVLLSVSFFPFLPILAIPLALLVPAGIHLGATLVWSRRRERVREGGRPRKAAVAIGIAMAAALLAALAPSPAGAEFNDRLALFRDKHLLGHPLGKLGAAIYYRYTLFAADPLTEFARRPQRIAVCADPAGAAALRALDYEVLPSGEGDVTLSDRGLWKGSETVPIRNLSELPRGLEELSGRTFRGGALRGAYALAMRAIFYAGPPAAMVLFAAVSAPFISIIFRVMTFKAAMVALLACVVSTVALLAWGESRAAGTLGPLEALRKNPDVERVRSGLAHASSVVRHEAAYRACRLADVRPLADALLKAADDPDFRVRLWACGALGRTDDGRAAARLLARLDDAELFVRYRAAEGLGLLGRPEAESALLEAMRNRGWYEGRYALEALRRIRPEKY